MLPYKTVLLLALASVKRVGDMHALSVSNSCMDFGPGDCKVVLKPRKGYVPKVLSTPFRDQVITLSAFAPSDFAMGGKAPLCYHSAPWNNKYITGI